MSFVGTQLFLRMKLEKTRGHTEGLKQSKKKQKVPDNELSLLRGVRGKTT